ncbi:hypothetical protein INT43_003526 [Umbelopsis isabellina]|uniref:Secreted protein n=1 Tax=Mortierella isabellina TaxID=91625 RepID=A0A8H7PQY7_MORIS|nr:hypothetical protein INT43_003526 [Umbelopsis isabellina]
MQSVQLTRLLLSMLLLLLFKFEEHDKKPIKRRRRENPAPILVVRSLPINIPSSNHAEAFAVLETAPTDTVPWPSWLTEKYDQQTAPSGDDDQNEDEDEIFVLEDL